MLTIFRTISLPLILSLGACGGGGGSSAAPVESPDPVDVVDPVVEPAEPLDPLDNAIKLVVDNSIIPAVEAFLLETEMLEELGSEFCSLLDRDSFSALQQQWRVMNDSWYRLSLYNFGPLNDDLVTPSYTFLDSLRLRGTDYTETVRSEISRDVTGAFDLDQAYFSNKTFQRVGLLALEAVIFETSPSEHSQVAVEIIAEYEMEPRKCDVLAGLSQLAVSQARYVQQGWLVAHKNSSESYRDLFLGDQLDDGTPPLNQLILSAQEFLDYLQSRNVVLTVGSISMHSWEAISATIDEVEALLEGAAESEDSLFGVMQSNGNQNEITSVRENMSAAREAMETRNVAMLEITLGYIDGNFKREIPGTLGVILGINFSDGD